MPKYVQQATVARQHMGGYSDQDVKYGVHSFQT